MWIEKCLSYFGDTLYIVSYKKDVGATVFKKNKNIFSIFCVLSQKYKFFVSKTERSSMR